VTVGASIGVRWIITGRSRVAGPGVLKSDWAGEDVAGMLQILLFEVCARRSRQARTKVWCRRVAPTSMESWIPARLPSLRRTP